MPIYEYECTACGHKLEALEKISDPALTHCPNCNKDDLHRLISAAGFQLKGTGWYATDFRDKGKPASTKTTSESSTTESGKTDTTTTSTEPSKKDTAGK